MAVHRRGRYWIRWWATIGIVGAHITELSSTGMERPGGGHRAGDRRLRPFLMNHAHVCRWIAALAAGEASLAVGGGGPSTRRWRAPSVAAAGRRGDVAVLVPAFYWIDNGANCCQALAFASTRVADAPRESAHRTLKGPRCLRPPRGSLARSRLRPCASNSPSDTPQPPGSARVSNSAR